MKNEKKVEKLYRYYSSDVTDCNCDEVCYCDRVYDLSIEEYNVIRETEKCYVIKTDYFSKEKFILKEKGGKRFAYATKDEALVGYIHRTQSCIWHTRRKLKMAETCLEKAKKMQK